MCVDMMGASETETPLNTSLTSQVRRAAIALSTHSAWVETSARNLGATASE